MKNIKPPITPQKIIKETIHGITISDPYRWLEEEGTKTNNWIGQQNNHTKSLLNNIPVKNKIADRLTELYTIDSIGIPVPKENRYFFIERKGSEELSVLYVQDNIKSKPRILIDQNKLSKDKTTVMKGWSPSWDGKLLAYSLSKSSNDQADIYVMDTITGKKLSDVIPKDPYPSWHVTWNPNNSGFWYTHCHPKAPKGEAKYHQKLYFHTLGTDFRDDPLIFGENLAKEDTVTTQISKDGRYLLITVYLSSSKKQKTEIYLKDLSYTESSCIPVIKGINSLFFASIYDDTLFIITNHKAPKWKILSVNVKDVKHGAKTWKTVIPEGKESVIDNYLIIKGNLFVTTLENVHSVLKVYNLQGKFIKEISLPTIGSINVLSGEQDGNELFFNFSSYLIPNIIYRYDLISQRTLEFKKVKIGIRDDLFTVKQIWYFSKDSTKIPMFLIHKKGIKLDGNNPTLIYGYGGFNINMTPTFNRTIIPFLENGGIYVDTILRGGGEFGEEWHKAGMKKKKQNVFNDFLAAAEHLIKHKYTNPNRLGIFGWSNGGLLVGAAITQRPELFKAAVIGAPVLDMLRYHLFHGGRHWIQEYGSIEDASEFKYLLQYSPYHNVDNQTNYPAILLLTTDKDDRVHPMHAFKMAAKLQQAISSKPVLIRIETNAGHSGAAPVHKFVEQYTDMWSFLYWQLEMV